MILATMPNPVIGDLLLECAHCGKRYRESAPKCPHCEDINPDYVPRSERFASRPRSPIVYKEGILTKTDENDKDVER